MTPARLRLVAMASYRSHIFGVKNSARIELIAAGKERQLQRRYYGAFEETREIAAACLGKCGN
tara:strand:- start:482 stop:670 length:189 start_codon:yes stop_codon:yes gene_type:complete